MSPLGEVARCQHKPNFLVEQFIETVLPPYWTLFLLDLE